MSEKKYLILVAIPFANVLRFTVSVYEQTDTRLKFVDSYTGEQKNFPLAWCSIEEVKK